MDFSRLVLTPKGRHMVYLMKNERVWERTLETMEAKYGSDGTCDEDEFHRRMDEMLDLLRQYGKEEGMEVG